MSNVNAEESSPSIDVNVVDLAIVNTGAGQVKKDKPALQKGDMKQEETAKEIDNKGKMAGENGTKADSSGNEDEAEAAQGVRRKVSEGDGEETQSKRRRTTSLTDETTTKGANKRSKSMDNDNEEEVIRERCISMLLKYLGGSKKAEEIATKVEVAIFEEIGDANDHRYRSRVRSRVANLTRNPAIGKQLIDGVICPERFAKMTAEELATPQLKELREHLSEGTMVEHMMGEKEKVGIENVKKSDNAI